MLPTENDRKSSRLGHATFVFSGAVIIVLLLGLLANHCDRWVTSVRAIRRTKEERSGLTPFFEHQFLSAELATLNVMKSDKSSEKPANINTELPTLSSFLLSDVQQMRPEGWSRLVSTFGPVVYRWCRVSGVTQDDAPDVVQEVFVTVARKVADFERRREQGSFRAWLATITRSRVRDFFRRQAKRGIAVGGTDAWNRLQQEPDMLDSTINTQSMQDQLLQHVARSVQSEFEPKTWQAFWLMAVEEKPAGMVAEQLGMNVASVYQAKSRVLRKLRSRVSEIPL